jgi:methyl-accepting chemotaxis protein
MFLILAGVIGTYNIVTTINSNKVQVQNYEKNLIKDYDTSIKNQVESAYTLLEYAYNKYKSGELAEDEAKALGSNLIKELRYGESGYFWVDTADGILVAHPMTPDAEGGNRIDIQDPDGTYLIQNIISAATTEGNDGFSEYMWEKPGVDQLVKKRVYSKLFEPWNYIISTGNYIDDIDALVAETKQEYEQEMISNIITQGIIIVVLLIVAGIVAYLFSNRISKYITDVTEHVKRVANNDLTAEALAIPTKDEFGQLSVAINQMVENLRNIIKDVMKASEQVTNHSDELTQSSSEVKDGSHQIAATMQELSSGSETQASSATDLSEAMSKFTTKIMEASTNSDHVTNSSNEVLGLTDEGSKLMASSIKQMTSIDKIVQEAVQKVQGLDQQSQEISKLVAVVQGIAEQTNLLALNAAIEAARAGEHGKGFAVVADEVRKLAEQVSLSVSDITDIVNGIKQESSKVASSLQNGYKEVANGTEQIKTTGITFDSINTSVSNMVSRIQTVTTNLSHITESSKQMNQSIENIAAISEESAAGVEQTAASMQQTNSSMEEIAGSAEQLSKLADDLNQLVRKFHV